MDAPPEILDQSTVNQRQHRSCGGVLTYLYAPCTGLRGIRGVKTLQVLIGYRLGALSRTPRVVNHRCRAVRDQERDADPYATTDQPDRRFSRKSPRRCRPPRRSWPVTEPAPSAAGSPTLSTPPTPSGPRRSTRWDSHGRRSDHRRPRASDRTLRLPTPVMTNRAIWRHPARPHRAVEGPDDPDRDRTSSAWTGHRRGPGGPVRCGPGRHLSPGCARPRGPPRASAAPDPCPATRRAVRVGRVRRPRLRRHRSRLHLRNTAVFTVGHPD